MLIQQELLEELEVIASGEQEIGVGVEDTFSKTSFKELFSPWPMHISNF